MKAENEAAVEDKSTARKTTTTETDPSTSVGHAETSFLGDLADAIERVWITKFGRVPVVAASVLHRMRKGW